MYYSEFTMKLIEQVKIREILYNTKYEKRPKPEKEDAWKQIGAALDVDAEKCKKHWKNVRDRFVKVMHQRDRHFFHGGSELDAPQYIYFDKLMFMREFSLKKDPNFDTSDTDMIISTNISPDRLCYEEFKDSSATSVFMDYTDQFLDLVKEFPVLFDENAERRKYRAKEAWKQISDSLAGRFTVGKLRLYWITLMKKYKLYLENPNAHYGIVENEQLFEQLTFANIGIQMKQRSTTSQSELHTEEEANSREFIEDISEEHLICEEIEDSSIDDEAEATELLEDEILLAVGNIEELPEAPPKKKIKIEAVNGGHAVEVTEMVPPPAPTTPTPEKSQTTTAAEDEFDYFGKKVSLQLRDLARKNRSVARKGEIKVLQLLMELEESLES